MGLESATYISQLVTTNPTGSDAKSQGDDHLRLLKSVLQSQFPNLGAAAVDASAAQLNTLLTTYLAWAGLQDFRLTLTSGSPVTSADVLAATTIYMTPYKGSYIALYDGTNWNIYSTTQISIAVPAVANQMYDVFCYANAGVPTLELAAWTNDTTRATALVYQNGVLVKSGATTRRYLGTIRTTGVAGQVEDSKAKRYVWNYNNRVMRQMQAVDSTGSWNYGVMVLRQANGSSTNQLDFVVGVAEGAVSANVQATAAPNSSGSSVTCAAYVAIGYDSTTAAHSDCLSTFPRCDLPGITAAQELPVTASLNFVPAAGRHYLAWLEAGTMLGTGTLAWFGTNTAISGITGTLMG